MGVSDRETKPEMRIATMMVTANSRNSRPMMPPRKRMGMKTAVSERVMETMVKPTSLAPSTAAAKGALPISMWRKMFSSMTTASSTTKPTARVRAMSERLSRLKPRSCMAAKVPTTDRGRARLGITVAETLRRKRKMTRTTRQRVSSRVNCTSLTDAWMGSALSNRMLRLAEAGIWLLKLGSRALTALETCDGIGAGLALDGQQDAAVVVEPGGHLVVLDAVEDAAQVLQAHRRAVAVGDDDGPELRGVVELAAWP